MASVDLQKKANFTRLSRLLVDKGTEALRNTFDAIHSPANLKAVLIANRTSLLKLKPRVINNHQWDLLFPPSSNPPDSKTFDVTLLTILFRNICGLPKTGWDAMPPDTDRTMQAFILRLKFLRNEIYAHVTSTQVDNATFKSLWQNISQALVDLSIPQNDVDDLKTCSLGPEEEIYLETLKEWKSQEEQSMKVLTSIVEKTRDEIKNVRAEKQINIEALQSSIAHEKDSIKCLSGDVKSIQYSVNRLAQITEENRDEIKQLHQSTLEQQSNIKIPESLINLPSQVSKDTDHQKNCSKESDADLLRKLAKYNFKGKIRRKVEFFHPGSREWLLQQVDGFVEKEQKSRMLLLTAGPGFGKSVFAAKVCDDFKKKGKLAACHFCDFSNANLRDPMMMLQSLASQMCENITGFKEELLDQLKRPHEVQSLKEAFTIYLQNPLEGEGLDLEEPSLVVIDGLDESAADNKDEIMNLITDYFQDLPECIKFLVTSRPEISVTKLRDVQKINIDTNNAKNNADLELYLKDCLPSLDDKKAEIGSFDGGLYKDRNRSVCQVLVKKCEGSFLYAFYVQLELQKRDDLDQMTFKEIMKFVPKGLDSIYLTYFNRLEDELRAINFNRLEDDPRVITHNSLDMLRILEMLVVSKAPLPLSFISRAIGLSPDNRETRKIIDKVNETVSCLLYVSDDLVTVFHKSVIDWLLAKGYKDHEYTVKVMDGIKSIWLSCEKVFEEIKKTVCSGQDLNLTNDVKYALKYGFDCLTACMIEESLFWSVDVVIIHVFLTIYPQRDDNTKYILNLWVKILQDSANISDKLQKRLSWHVLEIEFLDKETSDIKYYYLQSVLTHFPEGYFSDNEKEIAKALLSKVPRFVEYNCNEVEVLPLAAWRNREKSEVSAVGLSHEKTMAAVVAGLSYNYEWTIRVISVPNLVELWQYSTECRDMSCCLFAPDDSFVLFGKLETVLSIAERKEVTFFHGNEETFTSCAFSPNGKRLVTNDKYDDTIKLWDVSRQSLLASLCADEPVDWCSFSSTGLFIIGYSKHDKDVIEEDSDSFCVWNAITWQRSDERNIRDVKLKEPGAFQDKKCKRCFRPGIEELNSSKSLEMKVCVLFAFSTDKWEGAWSTGIYNGVECSFSLKDDTLSVVDNTHFTTLAAWNLFVYIYYELGDGNHTSDSLKKYKLTTIEDDLWFYADGEKLIVFRTLDPTHQQSSRLPRPTRVLPFSSSFSPDGSRLATCTSDGYINIWNVITGQVKQSFKRNQGESSFACWWSDDFLYVFDFFDKVPSLSKYPVDVNLKILFPQSQQVSLCHLLEEFVSLSAIVGFSEGLLSFECGKRKPVKVVDVSGVGGSRMVTLPGIKPRMSITVSPGASFVSGIYKYMYYIWKRNDAKEEQNVYEVFFTERSKTRHSCCFISNDSKVVVIADTSWGIFHINESKIFDPITSDHKSVKFDFKRNGRVDDSRRTKLFCVNKDRVVIVAKDHFLEFYDMDSGAHLGSSLQRYLTWDSLKQLKLSPDETMMAFPKINDDMEFLRLCIPQSSVLSSIKREATIRWHKELEEIIRLEEFRRRRKKFSTKFSDDSDDSGDSDYSDDNSDDSAVSDDSDDESNTSDYDYDNGDDNNIGDWDK